MAFHRTLKVRENLCKSCTHCMKRCPTGAIRIDRGHAQVEEAKCIDCGQCMQACPHHAIAVEQNLFEELFYFEKRVAIIPAVFFAQFDDQYSESQICQALYDIGFTHVYPAELGIDITRLYCVKGADCKPIISNFCPSVVRLIQTRYPSLVPHIGLKTTPSHVTALFARLELEDKGVGIFYVTPCPGKIAEFHRLAEASSAFNGVLNMDTVYNQVSTSLAKNKRKFAKEDGAMSFPVMTGSAATWALSNGELAGRKGRSLAIDEIHHVMEFLEFLEENEDESNIDFLELKACAEGCVGGILTARNRFLASERLRYWATSLPSELPEPLVQRIMKQKDAMMDKMTTPIHEVSAIALDDDIGVALYKMEKVRKITDALPGIDCGLCGSPTCSALAEDIAQGQASIRQCTVLRLKDPKEVNTLARIWGEKVTGEKGEGK
jgi:Na+-translocating ferredoxin:NAD+ oxidoreductase RNF subunit RnfB